MLFGSTGGDGSTHSSSLKKATMYLFTGVIKCTLIQMYTRPDKVIICLHY